MVRLIGVNNWCPENIFESSIRNSKSIAPEKGLFELKVSHDTHIRYFDAL
jgi:hypothetical protein